MSITKKLDAIALEKFYQSSPRPGDWLALTSAAPALLQACKAALAHLVPGDTLPMGSPLELIEQLQDAIKEAESQ